MRRKSAGDRIFTFVNTLVLVLVAFVTLYPFLNVLAISLNDAVDSMKGGITIFPRELSFSSYVLILQHPQLYSATLMTLYRTVTGLVVSLFFTSMLAYVLSKRDLIGYKLINGGFVVSMFLGAGLIPTFMLYKQLQLTNTFLVYILPGTIGVFNMILMRNFFDTLPDSMEESAKIDGANDLLIFFRIILPLSGPIVATVALFLAVGQWNAWTDTLYFTSDPSLETLQYLLVKIIRQAEAMQLTNTGRMRFQLRAKGAVTSDSVKMAITIVTTVPILCVYPFVQRFFVKGMIIGAVKG